MKNLVIVLLVALLYVIPSYGQKRVDGPDIVRIHKSSQVVSPIIGWGYDENFNKWCAYYSIILQEYKNNNKRPIYPNNALYSYNDYEVFSLQIKSVIFRGETLYLLYIGQQDYYYDYPISEVGYHAYKKTTVYIIKKEEYEKMWNLQTGINKIRILSGGFSFGHPRATYDNQDKMLAYQFNEKFSFAYREINPYNRGTLEPMAWYIKKEEDGTIRFQYPTNFGLLEDAIKYNKNIPENNYASRRDTSKAVDFSTKYYEISGSSYQKLRIQ